MAEVEHWVHELVDADAHVIEPNTMWAERMPESLRAQAPCSMTGDPIRWSPTADLRWILELRTIAKQRGMALDELSQRVRVGLRELGYAGEPVWRDIDDRVWKHGTVQTVRTHLDAAMAGFDAAAQAQALRRQGVTRAHLFPSAGLWVLAIDGMPAELAAALSRAYNDWLAEFCRHDPELLRPIAAVSLHDPAAAAAEVERCASWGWTAVTIRPNPIAGRPLGHPAHAQFFATCARLGIGVAIHEGAHARLATAGWDRFSTRFARHTCSHPIEQMLAFVSLLEGGVLERNPSLRVAFMEAGCSWLPYWLWRLDTNAYANLGFEVAGAVERPPSEYFRRQCWISCEPGEPMLEQVADLIGADRLLYGSDYPHVDHDAAIRADVQTLVDRLGKPTARAIMFANANGFYGCG